jgi:hypothetical protein
MSFQKEVISLPFTETPDYTSSSFTWFICSWDADNNHIPSWQCRLFYQQHELKLKPALLSNYSGTKILCLLLQFYKLDIYPKSGTIFILENRSTIKLAGTK